MTTWRSTRLIRVLPVEQLTPEECQRLLVHNSPTNTRERRKALWLKSGWENTK